MPKPKPPAQLGFELARDGSASELGPRIETWLSAHPHGEVRFRKLLPPEHSCALALNGLQDCYFGAGRSAREAFDDAVKTLAEYEARDRRH